MSATPDTTTSGGLANADHQASDKGKVASIKNAVDKLAISADRNHELGSSCNLSFEVQGGLTTGRYDGLNRGYT